MNGSLMQRAAMGTLGLGIAACAMALVAPRASALLQADDTAYSLQRTYKAGDVDHYKIDLDGNVAGVKALQGVNSFKLTMVEKETTKSVNADGSAVVHIDIDSATAKLGDQDMDATSFLPPVTQTRDKLGHIVSSVVDGGASSPLGNRDPSQILASIAAAYYSDKPVKIGDTWKIAIPESEAKRGLLSGASGTATFVSTEMLNGVKTAKIKATVDAMGGAKPGAATDPAAGEKKPSSLKAHVESTGNVDLATGKLLKLDATIEMELNGDPTKNKIKVTSVLTNGTDAPAAAAK